MSEDREIRLLKAMMEDIGLPNDRLSAKSKDEVENFVLLTKNTLKNIEHLLDDMEEAQYYDNVFYRIIEVYEKSDIIKDNMIILVRELFKNWNKDTKELVNSTLGEKIL